MRPSCAASNFQRLVLFPPTHSNLSFHMLRSLFLTHSSFFWLLISQHTLHRLVHCHVHLEWTFQYSFLAQTSLRRQQTRPVVRVPFSIPTSLRDPFAFNLVSSRKPQLKRYPFSLSTVLLPPLLAFTCYWLNPAFLSIFQLKLSSSAPPQFFIAYRVHVNYVVSHTLWKYLRVTLHVSDKVNVSS